MNATMPLSFGPVRDHDREDDLCIVTILYDVVEGPTGSKPALPSVTRLVLRMS